MTVFVLQDAPDAPHRPAALVTGVPRRRAARARPARDAEVVVLTSFPKELFEAYKQAFEQKTPGVKVIVKQQQTNQGVTYLRETRAGRRPTSSGSRRWTPSRPSRPTACSTGSTLPRETLARIPARIGSFPLHDPDGNYWGFAVSGYGLMWNTRYLALHKLPAPREWTDLADPRYSGHLVISAPVAQRHHASHRRGDPAGLRVGEGLGAAAADGRQHGRDHRAQLRGAGGGGLRASTASGS